MNNFDLPWTGDNFTFLKPSVCNPSNNNNLNITSFLTAFGNYSYNNCYYWMAAVIDIPNKWCRINARLQCQIRFYNQFIGLLKWLIKLPCSRCNLTMKHTIIRYNMKYNFPIINAEIIFRVWMQSPEAWFFLDISHRMTPAAGKLSLKFFVYSHLLHLHLFSICNGI